MSLSVSRKRRVECFGSYHDDLCIFSISLLTKARKLAWEKMLPFKGKQYIANIVSKEVGSLDQCRKLSDKATTQNTYISLLVSWQFIPFLPCEEYRSLS